MKELRRHPFVLTSTGLVVGIGAGIVVSYLLFLSNSDEQLPRANDPLTASLDSVRSDNQSNSQIDLASVFKLDTASARRIAVYRLLKGQSAQQIAKSLRDTFKLDKVKHLNSVQNLFFTVLARLDPDLALELVWETQRENWDVHLTVVFEDWAGADPRMAMQSAKQMHEPWKSKAFRTILQTRQDLSDAQHLELVESFDALASLNEMTFETQIEEVIDEPRKAFELILQAHISESRKSELIALITERWIERGNIDNIASMLGMVHEVFLWDQYQWRSVVSRLTATDPKLVWEQLATLSLDAQKMLNDEVFKAWVKQDAMAAIDAINESEYMSKESGELSLLYAAWASAVWHQLPEKIDLVPIDYRTGMLTSVVRDLAPRIEPSDLLKQLDQIQRKGVNTKSTLEVYLRQLSYQDPAIAMRWANEYLDEGNNVTSYILRELAVVDVIKAMEIALQQPVDSGAELAVISAVLDQGWLQQGLELLSKVREGTDVSILDASVGALLIENGRRSEALALAKTLPDEARGEYYLNLAQRWIYKDITEFLPVLSEIPDKRIRSRVAEVLLRWEGHIGNLTEDEIEVIRSFVQVPVEQ